MPSSAERQVPDPEISLRDARDFIVTSPITRHAFGCSDGDLPIFLQDILEAVYRLVQSCHLPEFTDHGLPHLCSLIDRISRWQLPPADGQRRHLTDVLEPDEAAILLIATLVHDIGMLSQNPIDLPDNATPLQRKALWSDVAAWVRQTHVERLHKLLRRLLRHAKLGQFLDSELFNRAIDVATSHQRWPWDWEGEWTQLPRVRGLAAVVAVADLLDEDSARCDTRTLLEHREGNLSNRAHWLRHALTENRVLVVDGRIRVEMVKPPRTGDLLKPVYSALRNHFRLVVLYEADLKSLDARITNIDLNPSTGVPDRASLVLDRWDEIPGFATEQAFCFQILRTFMPLVLKDSRRMDAKMAAALRLASLEDVDSRLLDACEGTEEPRTEFERTFAAIAASMT